jgi:hypothetical protein
MRALLGLSLTVVLASCGPVAAPKDHVWTVKTPPMVELDSTLRFTVETRTAAGEAIGAIPFVWTVEWVGAQEPVYPGSTFRDLAIRAKGSPGTATVMVFLREGGKSQVEVARSTVQVLPPPPPAR